MALPKKTRQPAGSDAASAPAAEAELHNADQPVAGPTGQPPGTAVASVKAGPGRHIGLASVEFDHPVPFNRTESSCRLKAGEVVLEESDGCILVYGMDFTCKVPLSRVKHIVYVSK